MEKIVYLPSSDHEDSFSGNNNQTHRCHILNHVFRALSPLSSLIPILFSIWVVWTKQKIDIWIFDADYYYFNNSVFLLVCFCWSCVAPWRKHFSGPVMCFVYNIIPIQLFLSLYYSQWNTIIPYLASAIWSLLVCFWWIKLDNAEEKDPQYARKHRRSMKFVWRRAIATFAAFMLIPSILGTIKIAGQAEHAIFLKDVMNPHIVSCIYNVNSTREQYEEAQESLFPSFSKNNWSSITPEEKEELSLELACFECCVLHVPSDGIKGICLSMNVPNEVDGYYNRSTQMIVLSTAVINGSNRDKALSALLVAVYEYYETQIIDQVYATLGWNSILANSRYFNEARAWQENMDNRYYSLDELYGDENAYLSQPYLKDAVSFANEELEKLHSYISDS